MNHQTLSQILKHKKLEDKFIESWHAYLTTMCEHISERERNSEKCEYAVDDMLKATYMENHIGEEFDATVDSCMNGAFFVQTDNFIDGRVDVMQKGEVEEGTEPTYVGIPAYYDYSEKLMGYTRNGRVDLRYGDRVRVRCIAADREKREIDFAFVRKL
jgi:ribonuclease R